MLLVDRQAGRFYDDQFVNLPAYLQRGDCLVLNDTRVFPARLRGNRNSASGAKVEVFLLRPLEDDQLTWTTLVKPGKRVLSGDRILFSPDLSCQVLTRGDFGERTIQFEAQRPIRELLDELGEVPLPPYIHRTPDAADRERYQTVYAQSRGSVAAPTAGLHFTPQLLNTCRDAGAQIARVTLHVGLGTFAPLRQSDLDQMRLHKENFEITESDAQIMGSATRLICVGTTSVRTVETACNRGGLAAMRGETDLFIRPGFPFKATGAMLTNFHLPQSSLLMLVSAFAGTDLTLAAYRHAVAARYRFFSYGDCMLIL